MRLQDWSLRLRIIGLGGLLSYAVFSQIPDPTEDHVRNALTRAAGELTIEDYVWLPSIGRVDDALRGRDVVFLGRSTAGRVAAYRAKVQLTLGGFPVHARDVHEILPTSLAESAQLQALDTHFAYVLERDGKVQSVVLGSQADPTRVRALALDRPTSPARLEFDARRLRVVAGSMGFDADLQAPEEVGFESVPNVASERVDRVLEHLSPSGVTSFDGLAARVAWGGEHPAVVGREEGDRSLVLVDGRQTTFVLAPGWGTATDTGFRPRGVLGSVSSAPIAALALPGLRGGGLVGDAAMTVPSDPDGGLYSGAGTLFFGSWRSTQSRGVLDAFIPFAGPPGGAGEATTLCVTSDGHLAVASGSTEASSREGLPPSCVVSASVPGRARLLEDAAAAAKLSHEETFLFVFGRDVTPSLGGRDDLVFAPFAEGAADPSFIPSIHRGKTDALGTTVTVHHVDVTRFDFKIVVGANEKSHRLGGKFEVGLPSSMADSFRFQLPLGVGKRMRPRGLRSLGNLGHAFSLNEGLLEVGDGSVRVSTGREQSACLDPALPCQSDATELPLSVNDGAPTDPSRQRGPLQSRVDLCVQGTQMLVAVSEFDTHEANATVLAQLGCARAVMVDRGSEHPSRWAGSERPGDLTSLVALQRPLSGRIVFADEQP